MIRIFIVDDHPVVIEGIHALLMNEKDIAWVGQAMNAASCLGFFVNNTADVILMDISMPGMDGIELCGVMKNKYPGIFILGLSTFNQGIYIKKMMENGASGYILKKTSPAQLIEAIEEVNGGGSPMSPGVANKVLHLFQQFVPKGKSVPSEVALLTIREKEILSLMMEGHNYQAIAKKLFISYDTVRTHVRSIYKKLHVASVNQAIVKAFKQRLV